MKNIYFKNSCDMVRVVKIDADPSKILHEISEYVRKLNPNYKIYYFRHWTDPTDPKTTWYDVGSHTEFFYVVEEE